MNSGLEYRKVFCYDDVDEIFRALAERAISLDEALTQSMSDSSRKAMETSRDVCKRIMQDIKACKPYTIMILVEGE